MNRWTTRVTALVALGLLVVVNATSAAAAPKTAGPTAVAAKAAATTTPIQHFVFLLQGGRTFDNYFGTYPGADGIPAGVCQAYSATDRAAGCVKPFDLKGSTDQPATMSAGRLASQYDGGKMDGFVSALQAKGGNGAVAMGYYDQQALQTYWTAANEYVLFDRFFSSTNQGQRVNRNYWVTGQAPSITVSAATAVNLYRDQLTIFDRLQASGVDWKFYVENYQAAATSRAAGDLIAQTARVPLLNYARFTDNPVLRSHIVDMSQYYKDLASGHLPAVSYIASSGANERTARSITAGQLLVTNLSQQLMLSKYWSSSALLVSYDSSGGWYDHVAPPQVDRNGYGFRVPALLISSFVSRGKVNHTAMDYTSALKFIEENWKLTPLGGRDKAANSLRSAFDFDSAPQPARLLVTQPLIGTAVPVVSPAKIIYWFYGGAILVSLLIMAGSFAFTRRQRRHRQDHPAPAAVEEKAGIL